MPDRLVIVPERGDDARPQTIVLNKNNVRGSIDEFVTAVWKHMDRWGLAVAGGYWKPVLNVEVQPGGEARFEELKTLLQGSGIDVQQKQVVTARGPSSSTTR